MDKNHIGIIDYGIILLILAISVFIGVYLGFENLIKNFFGKSKKQNAKTIYDRVSQIDDATDDDYDETSFTKPNKETNKFDNEVGDYLVAKSSMSALPLAFSLFASFYSATSLLGGPAEVYQYGIQFSIVTLSLMITPIIGGLVTGPFFSNLKMISIYEYLEIRFASKKVRILGTLFYVFRTFIGSSIFLYGPTSSLSALTFLNDQVSILIIGVVGTFYTAIGGIRAVIWTDVFQAVIMFASSFIIIAKGIYDIGGFKNLFQISLFNGRLNFFDFNPDPFVRISFWSLIIGQLALSGGFYCFDQQVIQRFTAAKSRRTGQLALFLNIPVGVVISFFISVIGIVVYGYFSKCDPLSSDRINNPNQLVGHFVMNSLGEYPGVVGLFLGSVLCACLSSLSSSLNSLVAVIWQDILKSFTYFNSFNDSQSARANKILAVFCGIVSTGLAFLISILPGNLLEISFTLNGSFYSPLIGLFLLGLLFRFTNEIGALAGALCGFAFALWISFGSYIIRPAYPKLNVSTEFCNHSHPYLAFKHYNIERLLDNENFTHKPVSFNSFTANFGTATNVQGFNKFYSISYMYYSSMGALITIIVGVIVSIITCGCKRKADKSLVLI